MSIVRVTQILILSFLFTSCNYTKNVRLLTGIEIRRTNYIQTIPFELRKDIIVIKAKLNADTVEREFIFDTGAFNSKIESDLVEKLGLETVATKTNSTAQGISRIIEVVRLDSLQLGRTMIYSVGAGKLNYDRRSASPCVASDGIIGANIIKLAHWKIDYQNRLLHFSDQPFDVEDSCYSVFFERPTLSGTPTIDIEVNERTVEGVIFDVGYNGGLVLPMSFQSAFESEESLILLDQSSSGIYGTNRDSLIVKYLEVGVGGTRHTIPVEFSSLNKALLGNDFLKHFDVAINYSDKVISLKPNSEVNIKPPRAFSISVMDDSLWIVSRTQLHSPLNLGDTLLRVNGSTANERYISYCDFVMNSSELYTDTMSIETKDGRVLTFYQQ